MRKARTVCSADASYGLSNLWLQTISDSGGGPPSLGPIGVAAMIENYEFLRPAGTADFFTPLENV
jgi:hypothetical protein